MKTYEVTIKVEWSGEVEASSEEEAREKAHEKTADMGEICEFDVWKVSKETEEIGPYLKIENMPECKPQDLAEFEKVRTDRCADVCANSQGECQGICR